MTSKNAFILTAMLGLSACGTIFSGSSQNINFTSNLQNIQIYANGALVCSSTPCRVDIDRGSSAMTVIAKADGYEDNIMQIKSKVNPASFGNLTFVYSWTTDFATSSMWKYTQDGVYINMAPKNMKKAEREQFKQDSLIRHFALINYPELRFEAANQKDNENITSLSALSNKSANELKVIINSAKDEVELAHLLTNIH